jgi:hypothetical protein
MAYSCQAYIYFNLRRWSEERDFHIALSEIQQSARAVRQRRQAQEQRHSFRADEPADRCHMVFAVA